MDIRIPAPRLPLTGQAMYDRLREVHLRITRDLQAEGKNEDWVPAWYVHLPSSQKMRIKWISREGPLIRFTTFDGVILILAPEAVAVTIEPLPEDAEGFPVEFLEEADEDVDEGN